MIEYNDEYWDAWGRLMTGCLLYQATDYADYSTEGWAEQREGLREDVQVAALDLAKAIKGQVKDAVSRVG
jgi:hypothetical protein